MIHHGDCIKVMAQMAENSVDAIVTDPPYGLEFMGKGWDGIGRRTNHPLDPSMQITAGEPEKGNPWASERSSYGAPKKNPRCRKCGRLGFGQDKYRCRCETPDWDTRTREYAQVMQAWHEAWAREAFRVAKPGAYLLAFGGTRTVHRLACAIEDAGWEIRDELIWVYASGFPKSLRVNSDPRFCQCESQPAAVASNGARIDLAPDADDRTSTEGLWASRSEGAQTPNGRSETRTPEDSPAGYPSGHGSDGESPLPAEVPAQASVQLPVGARPRSRSDTQGGDPSEHAPSRSRSLGEGNGHPSTLDSQRRVVGQACLHCSKPIADGMGTALKPAHEPIVMARKPLVGSVAANVTRYGTGALNIGATRIPSEAGGRPAVVGHDGKEVGTLYEGGFGGSHAAGVTDQGRWPSNLLLSDPDLFDVANPGVVGSGAVSASGVMRGGTERKPDVEAAKVAYGTFSGNATDEDTYGDSGGYSRFFIVPKADRADREPVLRGQLEARPTEREYGDTFSQGRNPKTGERTGNVLGPRENAHPTVKPTDLMRHLVRLVTPPGGTVLDCFLGSGSTAIAAEMEGFAWIGIEKEAEYVAIAEARLNGVQRGLGLVG